MILLTLFLLLLLAILLGVLAWGMLKVSRLRFENERSEVVAPKDAPEEILMRLKEQIEPLIESGFEYLGMMRESHGGVDFWKAFLTSTGGIVWAVAEESHEINGGRRVNLISFGGDGSIAITGDGDQSFGEGLQGDHLTIKPFSSALEQAESHVTLLTSEEIPLVEMEPDVFLARYKRLAFQGVDSFFEKEWLYEASDRSFRVPSAKLPVVGFAWLKHHLKVRARKKDGSSWLLDKNFGAASLPQEDELVEEAAPASVEGVEHQEPIAAQVVAEEAPIEDFAVDSFGAVPCAVAAGAVAAGAVAVGAVATASKSAAEVSTVGEVVAGVLDSNGLQESALEFIPTESMGVPAEEEIRKEPEPIFEEKIIEEEPAIPIPEEDGLPRDWALYQRQASKRSWAYWLGGFGGRALLFVSLLVFSLWMATSGGWGLRIVFYGLLALVVHELGHAIMMLLRRSWDWSHFLIPLPHPMLAKRWSIKGGFGEFLTVLAGPLPGLLVGWAILGRAYLGIQTGDQLLDVALALVVVNSVTLLPFLPLDGGRLLDLAFLRKMPRLRVLGLVVSGLVFLGLSFLGGGLLTGVLALLMWAGVPSARRKGKLLPWLRANSKDDEDVQVVTAFSVTRERSQRKSFKGAGGMARLDELVGLGQARKLGFLGCLMVLFVLAFTWLSPFALPAYSLVRNGQKWFQSQKVAVEQSEKYLGPVRPLSVSKAGVSPEESQKKERALATLDSWQKGIEANPTEAEKVFLGEAKMNAVRLMQWRLAAHWIAESPEKRQVVAREAARSLRRTAFHNADEGNSVQAFRDLSTALRIIIECEPRHSLGAWDSWFELEREILKEVEGVSSRYPLADSYAKWYETALAQCPAPTSRKVAGLLLAESQTPQSFVGDLKGLELKGLELKEFLAGLKEFEVKGVLPSKVDGSPGRGFLGALRKVGDFVSVDSLEEKQDIARVYAHSSSLSEASAKLAKQDRLSLEMEEVFQRIEHNYSFRQIAMSGLKVKRVGIGGAKRELEQLRKDFGFTARLNETNERKSLKLSRVTPNGELVEMEWLLQQ